MTHIDQETVLLRGTNSYGCSSVASRPDAGPSAKPRCQSLFATFSKSDLRVALLRAWRSDRAIIVLCDHQTISGVRIS